jgi:20S proteasome subunit alpha 5
MTMAAAETLAMQTLKQVMEEKISSTNVEIATVGIDTPFRLYSVEEMEAVIERL